MFLLSRELTSGEELRLEHGRKGSSPANLTPAKGLIRSFTASSRYPAIETHDAVKLLQIKDAELRKRPSHEVHQWDSESLVQKSPEGKLTCGHTANLQPHTRLFQALFLYALLLLIPGPNLASTKGTPAPNTLRHPNNVHAHCGPSR